jgi:glycine cleavage system H protein
MNVPEDRRYAKTHEWVRSEGDLAYVGITDYAQEELGDVVFVELPDVGDDFSKGDEVATVESVKASSPIYTPLGGKIAGVNQELDGTPELLNRKPYEAYLFTLTDFDAAELDDLMDAGAYTAFVEEEKKNH